MAKNNSEFHKNTKEEENDMAVLAKPINKITVIKEQESQKFIREFNENRVSEKFLDSCKKAGILFGNRK